MTSTQKYLSLIGSGLALLILIFLLWGRSSTPADGLNLAWQAVQNNPLNDHHWLHLGDEQMGQETLKEAALSYNTALELTKNPGDVYGRLGFLYYAQGKEKLAWEYLEKARSLGTRMPMLDWTLASLGAKYGHTDTHQEISTAVSQSLPEAKLKECSIELERRGDQGVFSLGLRINDIPAQLIVDTGANLSVLSRTFIEKIAAEVDEDNVLRVMTAAGPTHFPMAHIDKLELLGRQIEARKLPVCEDCTGQGTDGLLGLDLQEAFGMHLDLAHHQVRLLRCAEAP
jgi:predicted aspartyl protease